MGTPKELDDELLSELEKLELLEELDDGELLIEALELNEVELLLKEPLIDELRLEKLLDDGETAVAPPHPEAISATAMSTE